MTNNFIQSQKTTINPLKRRLVAAQKKVKPDVVLLKS